MDIEVKTIRKWQAEMVQQAELRLLGVGAQSRARLGSFPTSGEKGDSTELWKANLHQIKFFVQAVYDAIPNQSNVHTWGKAESTERPLCRERGTLEHTLRAA